MILSICQFVLCWLVFLSVIIFLWKLNKFSDDWFATRGCCAAAAPARPSVSQFTLRRRWKPAKSASSSCRIQSGTTWPSSSATSGWPRGISFSSMTTKDSGEFHFNLKINMLCLQPFFCLSKSFAFLRLFSMFPTCFDDSFFASFVKLFSFCC